MSIKRLFIFVCLTFLLKFYVKLTRFVIMVFSISVSMHYGGRTVRHMGTRSGINRDSPDGFHRLPPMAAQRATSTNPAVNRYGRSRSALYRADMAMGNPAQWSFHAPRAHPGLGSAHLSCRATWMLLDRAPPWRQRGRPQPVNQAQDLGEQRSWDGELRQLESDIAAVPDHLGADLDQLLTHRGHRPVLHLLGWRQFPLMAMSGHSGA